MIENREIIDLLAKVTWALIDRAMLDLSSVCMAERRCGTLRTYPKCMRYDSARIAPIDGRSEDSAASPEPSPRSIAAASFNLE